jgi:hypothetical protein
MKVRKSTPQGRITELHLPQFIDQLSADHLYRNPSSPSVPIPILLGEEEGGHFEWGFECEGAHEEHGEGRSGRFLVYNRTLKTHGIQTECLGR